MYLCIVWGWLVGGWGQNSRMFAWVSFSKVASLARTWQPISKAQRPAKINLPYFQR